MIPAKDQCKSREIKLVESQLNSDFHKIQLVN